MQNTNLNPIDLDAAAEAERFGALAVSRRSKNRGAKLTKKGLTTAQLRVLVDSASYIFGVLKRVRKVHVGKTTLEFSERGNKEIVEMHS